MEDSPFLDSVKFHKKVEEIAKAEDINYIDATVKACDHFMVEPEDIHELKLVNASLKDKIHSDAMSLGYLKRGAQLPI